MCTAPLLTRVHNYKTTAEGAVRGGTGDVFCAPSCRMWNKGDVCPHDAADARHCAQCRATPRTRVHFVRGLDPKRTSLRAVGYDATHPRAFRTRAGVKMHVSAYRSTRRPAITCITRYREAADARHCRQCRATPRTRVHFVRGRSARGTGDVCAPSCCGENPKSYWLPLAACRTAWLLPMAPCGFDHCLGSGHLAPK